MPFSAATFQEQFAALSNEEATAFVADLWRAREWDVERTNGRLVVRQSPTGPKRRLAVRTASATDPVPADVDAVVIATEDLKPAVPGDADVVDPDDLFRLIKFGVEPDRGERLLADHFEPVPSESEIALHEPPSDVSPSSSPNSDADDASPLDEATPSDQTQGPVPKAHVPSSDEPTDVASEVSGGVDNEETGGVDSGETHVVDSDEPAHVEGNDTAGVDADPLPTKRNEGDRSNPIRQHRRTILLTGGALFAGIGTGVATGVSIDTEPSVEAPGLAADGVVDPNAIAEAHAAEIAERSYSLEFDLVVRDADVSLRSYLSMALALAADRTARTRVSTAGDDAPNFLGEPPATAEFWSDGDVHLVDYSPGQSGSFDEFRPPDGFVGTWKYWAWMVPFGGTYGSRPRDYYETAFEAIPTKLVERTETDGGARYRIANDGAKLSVPSSLGEPGVSDVRDVRLDAVIDHRGVVRSFELRFAAAVADNPVTLYRSLEYEGFDETNVQQPTFDG